MRAESTPASDRCDGFSGRSVSAVAEGKGKGSAAMRSILGDYFVELYCAMKDNEYRVFQEIITPWEREILMFNV